ncbi:MAG TPA: type VI secretion system tube protein Hcp [Bryobacteraceae bacterium]
MALVDYFLKIDGIQGESNDSKHKNEIEIESFSWGANQSGTASHGGGMGGGRVQMQDFHFVMNINKASPKLMLSCANGEHIKSAILTCRKAGKEQQEYLKVTFTDLLVSSYQTGGSGSSGVVPLDQISLNFTKVEIEYKEQKPDGTLGGTIKAFYDMKQQVHG